MKQAQYNYVAASELLEKNFRSVQSTVRSSYNNVNASIGSVRAYSQSVISADSALKATEAGYEVGTRTIVDVLDSTRKLYEAKQKLSEARYNFILNILSLKQAAGVLEAQDLVEVNQGLMPATAKSQDQSLIVVIGNKKATLWSPFYIRVSSLAGDGPG